MAAVSNNAPRRKARGNYASLVARKGRDSPEALDAGRTFYAVTAREGLRDCVSRSPLPFTQDQIADIVSVLPGGGS